MMKIGDKESRKIYKLFLSVRDLAGTAGALHFLGRPKLILLRNTVFKKYQNYNPTRVSTESRQHGIP
jgi:hypothetical protein